MCHTWELSEVKYGVRVRRAHTLALFLPAPNGGAAEQSDNKWTQRRNAVGTTTISMSMAGVVK